MFAEVILSKRFPKHLGVFDYRVPASLETTIALGQRVRIPFRSSIKEGVVVQLKDQAIQGKRIKDIAAIVDVRPVITKQQIELGRWIADYYFVSLGTVIKMMLPEIPKKNLAAKELKKSPTTNIRSQQEITSLVQALGKDKAKRYFFWAKTVAEEQSFLHEIVKNVGKPILILVPTIQDIDWIQRVLPLHGNIIAWLHSDMKKNDFYANWRAVQTGKANVVLGTKLALFAPLQTIDTIVVYQSEKPNHKQSDQNPRFDSRDVGLKLAELHGAKLIFMSHSPTIEQYYACKEGKSKLLEVAQPQKKTPRLLIDMAEEIKKQSYSPISETLTDQIRQTLKEKSKVFLLLNRRGSASAVRCRDCGHVLQCEICHSTLTFYEYGKGDAGKPFLYCQKDNKQSELPPFCPSCSGVRFAFTGSGTQKIERELRRAFPKHKVARLDSDTDRLTTSFDILIGTERAIPILRTASVSLIGVLSADTTLHLPDFRSAERTYQLLAFLPYYAPLATFVIQTYASQHTAIQALAHDDPESFYEAELTQRKQFDYPPFMEIIKLIVQDQSAEKCRHRADRLLANLKTLAQNLSSLVRVQRLDPYVPRVHKKWRSYIVIKLPFSTSSQALQTFMHNVPSDILIDRDPERLL